MLALILSLSLAVHPNNFESGEVSSEDIFAGVAVCVDNMLRENPNAGESSTVAMCSCIMDARRANLRKKKPPEATKAQQAKCHKVAAERKAPKPGKAGT